MFSRRGEGSGTMWLSSNGHLRYESYEGCGFADDTTRYTGTFTRDGQRVRLRFEDTMSGPFEVDGVQVGDILTVEGRSLFSGEWELYRPPSQRK